MNSKLQPIISYATVTIIIYLLTIQASLAQLNQPDNQPGYSGDNSGIPCASIQNFNMFSIIHCAQLTNSRWDAYKSTGTIDSIASEFRKKQKQVWRRRQQIPNNSTQINSPVLNVLILPSSNNQSK